MMVSVNRVNATVSRFPVVAFTPLYGIVVVGRIGIYLVESHQPFKVGCPCPKVARACFVGDDVNGGVRPFLEKIVICEPHALQDMLWIRHRFRAGMRYECRNKRNCK